MAYAKTYGIPISQLDSLLNINFVSQLSRTRKTVDRQTVLSQNPRTGAFFRQPAGASSRPRNRHCPLCRGTESFYPTQCPHTDSGSERGRPDIRPSQRLDVVGHKAQPPSIQHATFASFTSGNQQSSLLPSLLLQATDPVQVRQLIEATENYNNSVSTFPAQLGPVAGAAWNRTVTSSIATTFNRSVELAIATGLHDGPAPYTSNLAKSGSIFRANLTMVQSRTNLVLDASRDLRHTTVNQENSASLALYADSAWLILVLALAFLGVFILNRSVGRPLARIVKASRSVQAGEFDVPALEVSGPRELSLATQAFNDMASTLCAVQAHALALSGINLDDPVLGTPLPGETGRALQETLTTLSESVHENQRQRALLGERATHDSLTGLLNRGAVLEFLDRDLAAMHREGSSLGILFIDLDGLKQINDSHGHETGDAALLAIARAIEATTRKSDVVGRLGGDEFIVGRLGRPDANALTQLANRICGRSPARSWR